MTLLLLAVYLPACTSYRAVDDPVAALQPSPKPVKKARVTVDTGKQFEVFTPRVSGDSLQGTLRGGDSVSVAMREIQSVEVRKPDGTKVGLLVLGSVLAAIAAGMGITVLVLGGG